MTQNLKTLTSGKALSTLLKTAKIKEMTSQFQDKSVARGSITVMKTCEGFTSTKFGNCRGWFHRSLNSALRLKSKIIIALTLGHKTFNDSCIHRIHKNSKAEVEFSLG